MATTTRKPDSLPAIRGNCRWLGSKPSPAADYTLTGAALLEISPIRADGKPGPVGTYWVRRTLDETTGRTVGFVLTKIGEAGETLDTYHLDLTFGGGFAHGSCDCDEFRQRHHLRADGKCKHLKSVEAALARAGLL